MRRLFNRWNRLVEVQRMLFLTSKFKLSQNVSVFALICKIKPLYSETAEQVPQTPLTSSADCYALALLGNKFREDNPEKFYIRPAGPFFSFFTFFLGMLGWGYLWVSDAYHFTEAYDGVFFLVLKTFFLLVLLERFLVFFASFDSRVHKGSNLPTKYATLWSFMQWNELACKPYFRQVVHE